MARCAPSSRRSSVNARRSRRARNGVPNAPNARLSVGLPSGLRASEGATHVLFITSAMAGPRRDAVQALAPGMCELTVDMFARVGAAAGAGRATLHVVQAEDTMIRTGAVEAVASAGLRGSDNPVEGIEHLAGVTGALSAGTCLPEMTRWFGSRARCRGYYVLGFEPLSGDRNGQSRPVDVRGRARRCAGARASEYHDGQARRRGRGEGADRDAAEHAARGAHVSRFAAPRRRVCVQQPGRRSAQGRQSC